MSKPFHVLKHEHRIIEQGLRALDGVCMRLEVSNMVPANELLRIIDFINAFADGYHHRKEETVLFPALERSGISRDGGPLRAMEHEHRIERGLIADLREATASYCQGDAKAANRFVESARAYLRLLVGHILKEDDILFRLGDEILDEQGKTALTDGFKQFDSDLGGRTVQEFESIASELEEKWAV